MYPHFLDEVAADQPDLLISVFATGAAAAARYRRESDGHVKTVVVMTDSFAHRLWVHEGTDLFLVTSHLAACSIRRYWPRARVEVVEAPVRPAFYAAPTKAEARAAVGVPADARSVLLMSGAWGIGPLDEAARGLADAGFWVLAVAGSNAKLARRLETVAADDPRVLPFGFTDRVPELMAASDAVVTSSGDTCREARVVGRGLVLLDVVPGHGRENLMHELELGNAVVASAEPVSLVAAVEVFLAGEAADIEPVTSPAHWEGQFRAALAGIGFP
jgi:UDP-N-acetylglucosamine:LPS N-acetylglucosamine transferase